MRVFRFLAISPVLLVATVAFSDVPSPPFPEQYVYDGASAFSAETRVALETVVIEHDRLTGEQFLIAVFPSFTEDPKQLGIRLFRDWKLGRLGHGQALVLLFDRQARKAHIQVGFGMDSELPQDRAQAIVSSGQVSDELREGRIDAAALDATAEILRAIESPVVANGKAVEVLAPARRAVGDPIREAHWTNWAWLPLLLLGLGLALFALLQAIGADAHYTAEGWTRVTFQQKLRLWRARWRARDERRSTVGGTHGTW